ncbi:type I-E CRISPR-associated protein Cas7/Cse4/CasC, partial [Streptomyces sp. NPDC047803]
MAGPPGGGGGPPGCKRRTASISLLGRMLAELPDANVDGAAQVAH